MKTVEELLAELEKKADTPEGKRTLKIALAMQKFQECGATNLALVQRKYYDSLVRLGFKKSKAQDAALKLRATDINLSSMGLVLTDKGTPEPTNE